MTNKTESKHEVRIPVPGTPVEIIADEEQEQQIEKELEQRVQANLPNAAMDRTIAESFPASDPPSSVPNPCHHEPCEDKEKDKAA